MTFCERKEKALEILQVNTEDSYERKCFPITYLPHRNFAPNYLSV